MLTRTYTCVFVYVRTYVYQLEVEIVNYLFRLIKSLVMITSMPKHPKFVRIIRTYIICM